MENPSATGAPGSSLPTDTAAAGGPSGVQEPPRSLGSILRRIGPGFVLAGTIVGSGELVATTATGAEAGFSLLWLIILGCVIKVFVQVEIGRQTVTHSESSLNAINSVPGPRLWFSLTKDRKVGANWIVWCWLMMFAATIVLFGGIIGGLGQSLAITIPLTEDGRILNQKRNLAMELRVKEAERKSVQLAEADATAAEKEKLKARFIKLNEEIPEVEGKLASLPSAASEAHDDKYWAAGLAAVTILLLVIGRYGFIEVLAFVLVSSFTIITIVNLFLLQGYESWSISGREILDGLSFSLPEASDERAPLITALATFGIIGVGAADLVLYPYWCLEKGYAKWTGKNDGSEAWKARARGWMRVLQWDAWSSCVLYTFSTVAFYLLGAAILGRIDLVPAGTEMIRTLSVMYEPVFGASAQLLFLFGAFAVLYSTYFIGNAGKCRLATDALGVMNAAKIDDASRARWIRCFAVIFPLVSTTIYFTVGSPVTLVLIGGVAQSLLLPMIAFAALYFRHRKCDPALQPGRAWDVMLVICFIVFLVIGGYLAYATVAGAL